MKNKVVSGVLVACAIAVPLGLSLYGIYCLADKAISKLTDNLFDAFAEGLADSEELAEISDLAETSVSPEADGLAEG